MLVIDAGTLFEIVSESDYAEPFQARVEADPELAAPHIIDVEVLGVIRRGFLTRALDATAAAIAVNSLRSWRGQRFGHQPLLARAWELRDNVRGWDAMYVALAESLDATLITTDGRLARVRGLHCRVEHLPVH